MIFIDREINCYARKAGPVSCDSVKRRDFHWWLVEAEKPMREQFKTCAASWSTHDLMILFSK